MYVAHVTHGDSPVVDAFENRVGSVKHVSKHTDANDTVRMNTEQIVLFGTQRFFTHTVCRKVVAKELPNIPSPKPGRSSSPRRSFSVHEDEPQQIGDVQPAQHGIEDHGHYVEAHGDEEHTDDDQTCQRLQTPLQRYD